ncbi:hypothetical protein L6R52_10915 [Myxococcota bacterium]|nr:hypothetical protein [Myxococcota bacterium]
MGGAVWIMVSGDEQHPILASSALGVALLVGYLAARLKKYRPEFYARAEIVIGAVAFLVSSAKLAAVWGLNSPRDIFPASTAVFGAIYLVQRGFTNLHEAAERAHREAQDALVAKHLAHVGRPASTGDNEDQGSKGGWSDV